MLRPFACPTATDLPQPATGLATTTARPDPAIAAFVPVSDPPNAP